MGAALGFVVDGETDGFVVDGETVGDDDEGETEGFDEEGATLGLPKGAFDGVRDGDRLGVLLGDLLGFRLGDRLGARLGVLLGLLVVGVLLGDRLGVFEGDRLGVFEGVPLGCADGDVVIGGTHTQKTCWSERLHVIPPAPLSHPPPLVDAASPDVPVVPESDVPQLPQLLLTAPLPVIPVQMLFPSLRITESALEMDPPAKSAPQLFAISVPPVVLARTCAVELKNAPPPGERGVDIVSPVYAIHAYVAEHVSPSTDARLAHDAVVVARFPRFPFVNPVRPYRTIGTSTAPAPAPAPTNTPARNTPARRMDGSNVVLTPA